MRTLTLMAALSLLACDSGEDETPALGDVGGTTADEGMAEGDARPRDAGLGRDGQTDIGPEIDVVPTTLTVLGERGEASEPAPLTIRNVGSDPLTVTELEVEGTPFSLVDVPALPAVVEPGAEVVVGVVFTAPGPSDQSGAVFVSSDDADEPRVRVPVTGRVPRSCLRAMPSTVDVGSVEPGVQSGRFVVQLVNCGDIPVRLADAVVEGDPAFGWVVQRGGELVGAELAPGDSRDLAFWYTNEGLPPNEVATGTFVLTSEADATPELRIQLRARGGDGPSCILSLDPDRLDFEFVRLGTSRALEIDLVNSGTEECLIENLVVHHADGPEANTFTVSRGVQQERLEGGARATVEVTFDAVELFAPGNRAALRVEYHDPHREQNRAEEANLRGVSTQALVAALPGGLYFGEVTAPGCASRTMRVDIDNGGFIPMCLTGFRYEGEACDRFVKVVEPEIDGCLQLAPEDATPFEFRYQPDEVADDSCDLVVESDAMNFPELAVPLTGAGVPEAATVDEHEVGRLNGMQRAYFGMRRPAVEDSVRVFVDERATDAWRFEADRNAVSFAPDDHPPRDSVVRIEYDAICFERL